jgi:hypothetical protein
MTKKERELRAKRLAARYRRRLTKLQTRVAKMSADQIATELTDVERAVLPTDITGWRPWNCLDDWKVTR